VHPDNPVMTRIVLATAEIVIMAAITGNPADSILLVMTDFKQQHTVGFKEAMGAT